MTTYSINLDEVDLALLPLRTNDFLKKERYQFQVFKEHGTGWYIPGDPHSCRMTTYSINLDEVDLALLPLRTNDFLKKERYQFQIIKEHGTGWYIPGVPHSCRITTCSINLDEVDLALLPFRTNDFLKKERYQFQVIKEHGTEVPELAATYTCHICALEVPAAFAREHATSVKHRTNARIASVATQRTHALISALPPPLTVQISARFCVNCTAIVDEDHEKTKEHRVAVMHDNLLCELMKAYVGDDDDSKQQNASNNKIIDKNQDNEIEQHHKSVADNVSSNNAEETHTIYNHTVQKEDKTDNLSKNNDQPIVNCNINKASENNSKNEECSKADITKNNMNNNKSDNNTLANTELPTTSTWVKKLFQSKDETENGTIKNESIRTKRKENVEQKLKHVREPYEKELRKFMNANNQFQIKEMYHRIQIIKNDDTVNVYSDHFHSFHRLYKNGDIECIVCNITFNEKDSESHKYSLNHMSGVVKIGDDGEYVREINEAYSHCILCNQKINSMNVIKHKQSNHHNLRKTNNVRSNAKPKETTGRNDNDNPTTNGNTSNVTVDVDKGPYEEIGGELRCLVCDCRVPRDLNNRNDHAKGLRHLNNLKTN